MEASLIQKDNEMSSNTEAIKLLSEDLQRLLDNEGSTDRELILGLVRAQRSTLPLWVQQDEDHRKTRTMWGVFYPAIALTSSLTVGMGTILEKLLTGELKITKP